MKKSRIGVVATVVVAGAVAVLFFLTALFFLLWGIVGHSAGDQVRRQEVRDFVARVYNAKPVMFRSADGVDISGLFIRRHGAYGTAILCHGYSHSKERMTRYISLFPGYNILLFDFRGFGQSGGFFSSVGYYESNDVKAAVEFARREIPSSELRPVVILGVSMGAAAALKAAAETSVGIDGLILDSPYATLREITDEAAHRFSPVPRPIMKGVSWFLEKVVGPIFEMSPERYAAHLSIPVFFIHSRSDTTTHPSHSMRLFSRVCARRRAPTWLWLTPPARHACCFSCYPRPYRRRVALFLARVARFALSDGCCFYGGAPD